MLKENFKSCTTIFFLIFVLYIIINILPSVVSSYNGERSVVSNLEDANVYLGEKRDSVIDKTTSDIEDYMSRNTDVSLDRLRENILKKADKYQEDSNKMRNFVKKYTGIDIGKVAEKFFSIESYELKGNK